MIGIRLGFVERDAGDRDLWRRRTRVANTMMSGGGGEVVQVEDKDMR